MMHYTYVLKSSKDGKWYIGCTDNLKRRITEHKKGMIEATKNRLPVELVYYEACLNRYKAYKREKYLKSGFGRKYLENRV